MRGSEKSGIPFSLAPFVRLRIGDVARCAHEVLQILHSQKNFAEIIQLYK